MMKINITLENQNELNEILNEVSKKAKELQEAITRLEQFEIKISVKELVEKQVLSSENGKVLFNLESGTFIIKKSQ
ncbi:hypothetical protein [Streptococcus australis]|uniref:hypothetical protein n=1 Tax=Streptococcus australis TaxID=113107 RepID=UPI00189F1268|nr:hypothetical protein [Streptococcus australis]